MTTRAYRVHPRPGCRYQVIGDPIIGNAVVTTAGTEVRGSVAVVWPDHSTVVPVDDLVRVPVDVRYGSTRSGIGPKVTERPYPDMSREHWSHLWTEQPIVTCKTGRANHVGPHPLVTQDDLPADCRVVTNPPHYCTDVAVITPGDEGAVTWPAVAAIGIAGGLGLTAVEAIPRPMFVAAAIIVGAVALAVLVSGTWRRRHVR